MFRYNEHVNNFEQFPELFQSEMGCLKDFELDVKFKPDAQVIVLQAESSPHRVAGGSQSRLRRRH